MLNMSTKFHWNQSYRSRDRQAIKQTNYTILEVKLEPRSFKKELLNSNKNSTTDSIKKKNTLKNIYWFVFYVTSCVSMWLMLFYVSCIGHWLVFFTPSDVPYRGEATVITVLSCDVFVFDKPSITLWDDCNFECLLNQSFEMPAVHLL